MRWWKNLRRVSCTYNLWPVGLYVVYRPSTNDRETLGKFTDIAKMVTSRILLEDVVTKGFDELMTNKDDHVKILVTPRRECLEALGASEIRSGGLQ